jgi:hypothetical protein
MSNLSRIRCHAVHSMRASAREVLAQDLFAVHSQIFIGLSFEEFRSYVVERDAWRTWIYVKYNAAGKLVGYTSIHAFRQLLEGRLSTVIRMEAGTLPAYRGRDVTMVYGVLRLLRVWLRHPLEALLHLRGPDASEQLHLPGALRPRDLAECQAAGHSGERDAAHGGAGADLPPRTRGCGQSAAAARELDHFGDARGARPLDGQQAAGHALSTWTATRGTCRATGC